MTRNEYIEMLKAEYRALNRQIIELERRQKKIHEHIEELKDNEYYKLDPKLVNKTFNFIIGGKDDNR